MWNELMAKKVAMPKPEDALPGRTTVMPVPERHFVLDAPLRGPFPSGLQQALFGMGCFWGAERKFWQQAGVYTTAVGYAGGYTPNPTYEEVCSGRTGHNEVVLVVFDPQQISYEKLLQLFWESHNPTHGLEGLACVDICKDDWEVELIAQVKRGGRDVCKRVGEFFNTYEI